MNANEAIKISIDTADQMCRAYLDDLSEEELLHRPHPQCNHIKWQLGHLIAADNQMVNGCCPGTVPELPSGFADRYAKEKSTSDDPNGFDTKAGLMGLYDQQRAAIMAKLAELTDQDLGAEAPEEMRSYAPTVGAAFGLVGLHWTMHSGQWAVIRRQLGRPPII